MSIKPWLCASKGDVVSHYWTYSPYSWNGWNCSMIKQMFLCFNETNDEQNQDSNALAAYDAIQCCLEEHGGYWNGTRFGKEGQNEHE